MSVEPCAPISISISMVLGVLFFIAGAGVLFRRRWAMFLGLPLLIMVEALAIPVVLEQFRQGDQPGSFAAIGIPIFGTVAVLAAVAFIVLLRAALAARH